MKPVIKSYFERWNGRPLRCWKVEYYQDYSRDYSPAGSVKRTADGFMLWRGAVRFVELLYQTKVIDR